jgi:hypothetical protein
VFLLLSLFLSLKDRVSSSRAPRTRSPYPQKTELETHLTPCSAPQSFQFSLFKRI